MTDTISFQPSLASSSTSLGRDAPEASQSNSTDYVLPPLPIDSTPISHLLPLAFTQQAHELYEAKAPPALPLPPLLAYPKKIYNEAHATSDASLLGLPPSPSSVVSFVDQPPPEPRAAAVPRCVPPQSRAHAAFPSPPPSPALSDTPTLSDATILNESPHLRPPPRAPALPAGRRYLAPAYVRGQCLPFAIDEEEESQSMSKHSAESATRLADGGAKAAASATTTTTTTTNVHNASASAFPCGGYLGDEPLSPDAEPDRAWRSVPMERRRSGKKRSSFRKRVHRVMLVIPALTMRSGLWF